MSNIIKSISALLLITVSSISYAETSNAMTLVLAKKQVNEYRALRRVCTVSILDTKQDCFKELKQLTHKYKAAKHYLVKNRPSEELILGYIH